MVSASVVYDNARPDVVDRGGNRDQESDRPRHQGGR